MIRALDIASAEARRGNTKISGDLMRASLEKARAQTEPALDDPDAMAAQIRAMPESLRRRGMELLAQFNASQGSSTAHTLTSLRYLLRYPIGRFLPPLTRPEDLRLDPASTLEQALARVERMMEKHGLRDPILLARASSMFSIGIKAEEMFRRTVSLIRELKGAPKDEAGSEETLRRIATLESRLKGLHRNLTYPCLIGPAAQTKEAALALAKARLEASGTPLEDLTDEKLEKRVVIIDLANQQEAAEPLRGHHDTYVGSQPALYLRKKIEVGVENPIVIVLNLHLASQKVQDAFLPYVDPIQNNAINDDKMKTTFDHSGDMIIATAEHTAGVSEALMSRLTPMKLSALSEERKIQRMVNDVLPKLREKIPETQVAFEDLPGILRHLIREYTSETDVQQLTERMRVILRQGLGDHDLKGSTIVLTWDDIKDRYGSALGPPQEISGLERRPSNPGEMRCPFLREGTGVLRSLTASFRPAVNPGEGLSLKIMGLKDPPPPVITQCIERGLDLVLHHPALFDVKLPGSGQFNIEIPMSDRDISDKVVRDGDSLGLDVLLALISMLRRSPLDPTVTGTGALTDFGEVRGVEALEAKIAAARAAGLTTFFFSEDNRRQLEEESLSNEDFAQGLIVGVSETGALEGRIFLPDKRPLPGTSKSGIASIEAWTRLKTTLEAQAGSSECHVETTPLGAYIVGPLEKAEAFVGAHPELRPSMTYVSVRDLQGLAQVLPFAFPGRPRGILPGRTTPVPATVDQTHTPASRAVAIFGVILTATITFLTGLPGLITGLIFGRRLWNALTGSQWTKLTSSTQMKVLLDLQITFGNRVGRVEVMETSNRRGFRELLLAPSGPLVMIKDGVLFVDPGLLGALGPANKNPFSRAAAMNAVLHELEIHGENEAKGLLAEFRWGKTVSSFLEPVHPFLRPLVFLIRYVVALGNASEILAHKLGLLKGIHQPVQRPEETEDRPLAIPFRIIADNRGADANRTNVLTFREDKLSDPAALVELKALERGRPMACVVTDEASARAKLEIVLGKIRATEVHLIPQTAVSAGNRIDENAVEKAVAQRMNGAAVRLKILEDAEHQDLWIGEALKILLTPLQESVEILDNAAGESVLQRLFAGQDEALRHALLKLHTKGRFTLPPGNNLPVLNSIGGNQIYLIQA